MSLVVLGTGTEVGKTVVSALIMARYGQQCRLGYWKPIASGASEGRDTKSVARWVGHLGEVHDELYLFDAPLSPHLAARLERRVIDPIAVKRTLASLQRADSRRHLIIEGIGGVLVPITDEGLLLIDLVARFRLPCVVVAPSTLGTINHSLLTLEALRGRRIRIIGMVFSGPRNAENRKAIERFGGVATVGEVDIVQPLTRAGFTAAAKCFDRSAILEGHLL